MPIYNTGMINVTNGSTAVTGLGVNWLSPTVIGEGDQLIIQGATYIISSVNSATSLTLYNPFADSSQSGVAYAINLMPASVRDASAIKTALQNLNDNVLLKVSGQSGYDATYAGGNYYITVPNYTEVRKDVPLIVKFMQSNSAADPFLFINGANSKKILLNSTSNTVPAGAIKASSVLLLQYDPLLYNNAGAHLRIADSSSAPVSIVEPQQFTSIEQEQARSNLGLGTAAILNAGGANGLAQLNSIGVLALPASALTVGQITLGYGASSIASNVALGVNVLPANTTGANNVGVGEAALLRNTTGASNVATGRWAMLYNTAGSNNTAVGDFALINNLTGNNNTAVGAGALSNVSSALNCSGLGANSYVTGSNQVQLGDSSTTTYVYGTVQNRSDERDKADIRPTRLGLDFVNMLEPVDYRYDLREDYREAAPLAPLAPPPDASAEDVERHAAAMSEYVAQRDLWAENSKLAAISRDGSKKRKRYHSGLIAQSVESAVTKTGFDTRGWGAVQNHALSGGDEVMSLGYDQFVPVLVKACQELSARVIALEKRLADTDPA